MFIIYQLSDTDMGRNTNRVNNARLGWVSVVQRLTDRRVVGQRLRLTVESRMSVFLMYVFAHEYTSSVDMLSIQLKDSIIVL